MNILPVYEYAFNFVKKSANIQKLLFYGGLKNKARNGRKMFSKISEQKKNLISIRTICRINRGLKEIIFYKLEMG